MSNDWLDQTVVLNESREEAAAGDISIFRSAGDACSSLEHWWVERGEGFAFTATGDRLILGVDAKRRVIVAGQQHVPCGRDIVMGWLQASAAAVLISRSGKAARGRVKLSDYEERGQLPTSAEGLIAYIGFGN